MTATQLLRQDTGRPFRDRAGHPAPRPRWAPVSGRKLGIATVGLLMLLMDQGLVVLPCLLALASTQLPGRSLVRRLALAVLCLFGLNAAVLTVLAVLDVPVHTAYLAACYLVLGGLVPSSRSSTRGRGAIGDSRDWWALASALATFAIFYRPFVGASLGERLALLSYSTDAGNHLSYVQANLAESGYMALSQYPQAWAGNVALVIDLLIGKDASPLAFVTTAAPLIIGCYALLVFFSVTLVLDLVQATTGRMHTLPAALATMSVSVAAVLGSGTFLLISASYTQVMAMSVLVVVAGLLASPPQRDWRYLGTLGLLCIALMQTWYLLAPVLAGLVLVATSGMGSRRLRVMVAAPPVALLAVYPVMNGPAVIAHLNASGGTVFTSPLSTFVMFFLTLAAAGGLVAQRITASGQPPVLLLLIVTTLLLTTVVAAIQVSAGNGFGYYTLKLLLVVFWFGALACAVVVAVLIDRTMRGHRPSTGLSWVACIAVTGMLLGGLAAAAGGSRDLLGRYAAGSTAPNVDGRVLDAIFAAHPQGLDAGTDAWVVDGCSRVADHIANKWIHDLFLTWEGSRSHTNNLYRSGPAGDVSMLLARAAEVEVQRMEIYVHRDCTPAALARLAASSKVTIVRVD